MAGTIKIKLVRSPICTPEKHKVIVRALGLKNHSLLAAAHHHGVPVYTSSPGDSSIGMNVAALELQGGKLRLLAVFTVEGEEKRNALARVMADDPTAPATRVRAGCVSGIVDRSAAGVD